MSNPNPSRTPAGVPTGGQFAASAHAESGVGLEDSRFDENGDYTGDYDPYEECVAIGQHLTHVDDDGYCVFCGDDTPTEQVPDFSAVANPEWREECEGYSTQYALAPTTADHTPDWSRSTKVTADQVRVGDRVFNGCVITRIDDSTPDVLRLCFDGHTNPTGDLVVGPGDLISVHDERVDLSDPDWFEVEANRITAETFEGRYPDGAPDQADYDEVSTEIRRRLTRTMQSTNISPLHNDDVRAANGRAKVGDNVGYSSPMYGDTAYEIIGKRHPQVITGHDGTEVTWATSGDVEYITKDLTTGHQSTADLRGFGWRRIPAPGDHGPGAQAQAFVRS